MLVGCGVALTLAGCGSSTTASTSATTATKAAANVTSSASPSTAAAASATTAAATAVATTAPASGAPTTSGAVGGRPAGVSDPCGVLALADVQVLFPGVAAGEPSDIGTSGGLCKYTVDAQHRLNVSFTTASAEVAAKTKAQVAKLAGQTVVDGLGDVGYSSSKQDVASGLTRLDVHFFKGTTEVLLSAFGQAGGMDAVVGLAKKAAAGA